MADQNCENLEEIALGCKRNSGGVFRFYVGDMEDISDIVENETTYQVTTLDVAIAPVELQVKRRFSEVLEEETHDLEAGSDAVVNTANVMLPRREALKSRAVRIMGQGQRYLYVVYKDANKLWWYIPYMQLQTAGGTSGKNRADGSRYDLVFIGDDDVLKKQIPESVVNSMLAVS